MYTYIYYKDRVELPNTVISAYVQGASIVHIDKKQCCLVLVLVYIRIIKRKLCVRLQFEFPLMQGHSQRIWKALQATIQQLL